MSGLAPGVTFPSPTGTAPMPGLAPGILGGLIIPTVVLRCPGGCGVEIEYPGEMGPTPATGYMASPCKYRCRVRAELFWKKVAEAQKK